MLRTSTGQTGIDAYVFEATAIANAQMALDRRMRELRAVVAEEAPELFEHSTDYQWADATSAYSFSGYLRDNAS